MYVKVIKNWWLPLLIIVIFASSLSLAAHNKEQDPIYLELKRLEGSYLYGFGRLCISKIHEYPLYEISFLLKLLSLVDSYPILNRDIYMALCKFKNMRVESIRGRPTLLHVAVAERWPSIVMLLLAVGADPLLANEKSLETPLHCACREGWLDIVKLLVWSSDCNDYEDGAGRTAYDLLLISYSLRFWFGYSQRKNEDLIKTYKFLTENGFLIKKRRIAFWGSG